MEKHESEVYQLIEEIEIQATCIDCGRMSLAILIGSSCPHCEEKR